MKKLLIIVVFVSIVFISLLDSLQILTNNWSRASGYPLYELVEEREISEFNKMKDTRQMATFHVNEDERYLLTKENRKNAMTGFNEEFVTLTDENGSPLWSMKGKNESGWKRKFYTSSKGITLIYHYDSISSYAWIDKDSKILNSFKLEEMQTAYPQTLKNGEIWLFQTEYDFYNFGTNPKEIQNLTSLIFFDNRGNVVNEIDLKYNSLANDFTVSKNENYLVYTCENIRSNSNDGFQICSYLLNFDGSVIKEYEGKALTFNGDFSDNEDVYVDRGSKSYIIDVTTGDIMATYSTQGRSVVADKETGILAVLDHGELRIINYKTKQVLFHERFEGYPHPTYLEITGDAKEVIVITKDHQYTFRMKE